MAGHPFQRPGALTACEGIGLSGYNSLILNEKFQPGIVWKNNASSGCRENANG